MVSIGNQWDILLSEEWNKEYYQQLRKILKHEYTSTVVYPNMHDIFNALKYVDYSECKVVIIGQDPYHGPGQAHGLSFSVKPGVRVPPSLQNIYKEIESDIGRPSSTHGDLTHWAEQGVLLLNATLTVRAHAAASHAGMGWEQFTDAVIAACSARENIVYMLWGSYAQRKAQIVDANRNLVLKSVHPSPLSAYHGFFGNHHFSRANEYLAQHGKEPIDW